MAPLPTTAARLLRAQALELVIGSDVAEPLELDTPNPLLPVAYAGGLAIYAPETCYALAMEGGAK